MKGAIKRPSTKLSSNEVAGGVTTSSAERTVKGFSEGGSTAVAESSTGGGVTLELMEQTLSKEATTQLIPAEVGRTVVRDSQAKVEKR